MDKFSLIVFIFYTYLKFDKTFISAKMRHNQYNNTIFRLTSFFCIFFSPVLVLNSPSIRYSPGHI